MSDPRQPDQRQHAVHVDLVEYFIVAAADVEGLARVGTALAELVRSASFRVLDVVALSRDRAGEVEVWELEAIPELMVVASAAGAREVLSEHDIELSALALPLGAAGVVVLAEDRCAEPLSVAASAAGGQIVAGDRIPPVRVEAALTGHGAGEGLTDPSSTRRRSRPDLLGRAPSGVVEAERTAWAALVIDPVAQLAELDGLLTRGLISRDEFELLKSRIVSSDAAINWATSDGPSPPPPNER